jgi:CHAT domain-containing protein/Tfp pilus assembly protein PilF
MCLIRAVIIIIIFAAGLVGSSAQPSSGSPSARAALEEAKQLTELIEKLYAKAKYAEAVVPAQRALALREEALGPSHPDVAKSLNDLGRVYWSQGEYAKAEPLYTRALAIHEKALGPSHLDVADSLNNLAVLYKDQGAYAKAEPLMARALAIRENALGPSHPDVAGSLNNLAALYGNQGAYLKAEPLYTRALAIKEKALGLSHSEVATVLNNLALLYRDQGAYAKAEPLFTRALAIDEKAHGSSHPKVATDLNNLAGLYRRIGAYAKAEPLFVRALAIRERTLGPNHPMVASCLNNLAALYRDQGAYAEAEPLLVRALVIVEKSLGPSHRLVALALNNLGAIYRDQGEYANAEPLLARAVAMAEKELGPSHPEVANSLNNLARLHRAQGAHDKAEPLVARAADIQEHELRTELVRLSEPRKRAVMTLLQDKTDSIVSLHADARPRSTSALEFALTTVLRRKGRILDSMVDSNTRIRRHLTPQLRDQLDQLAQARTELVAQLYAPAGSPLRAQATATRAQIDELESTLSKASAEFRTEVEPITLAKIQEALPAGTALVELVRYRRDDPRQPERQGRQEERYVAYLVTSRGAPQWIALGEGAPIDAQIDAVLGAIHCKAAGEKTRAELQRLDALVLAPIRSRLSGISHLLVAPDGKLNLVPFEALVDPHGRYALENYLVSYVTSGRDLLRSTPRSPRSSAVIIADPDYGPLPKRRAPGTLAIAQLPGTRAEAADLRRYFPAAPLTGARATKFALATLKGPAMLHIATHGFVRPDPGVLPAPPACTPVQSDGVRDMYVDGETSSSAPSAGADDLANALDRSGLAMAGANVGSDGIMTAREIAGLDWWGTQLVVLSACETGRGAVATHEGVYGLRRALLLAGAASQVVSLWSVSDNATRALMREYYARLALGIGRAEALRQAKQHLINHSRYTHPYYWAAFIPAGDWRPLDKRVFAPLIHSK